RDGVQRGVEGEEQAADARQGAEGPRDAEKVGAGQERVARRIAPHDRGEGNQAVRGPGPPAKEEGNGHGPRRPRDRRREGRPKTQVLRQPALENIPAYAVKYHVTTNNHENGREGPRMA